MIKRFFFNPHELIPPGYECRKDFKRPTSDPWSHEKIKLVDETNDLIYYISETSLYCYKRVLFKGNKTEFFSLHRDDGWPAYMTPRLIYWYKDGECHKETGPSGLELTEVYGFAQIYAINGRFHREDGPAIVREVGRDMWYKNHQFIKSEEIK